MRQRQGDEVGTRTSTPPCAQVMTGAVLDTVGRAVQLRDRRAARSSTCKGNVGIVREGNRLEFLVGDNLEKRQNELRGALLGVKMTFTPAPTHLVLAAHQARRHRDRGQPAAAAGLSRCRRSCAPTRSTLRRPGAPLPEIKWKHTETVQPYLPKKEGDAAHRHPVGGRAVRARAAHNLTDAQPPSRRQGHGLVRGVPEGDGPDRRPHARRRVHAAAAAGRRSCRWWARSR